MKRKILATLLLLALCAGMMLPAAAAPVRAQTSVCSQSPETVPAWFRLLMELFAMRAEAPAAPARPEQQTQKPEEPEEPEPRPQTPEDEPEELTQQTDVHPYERAVVSLVNQERARAGLPALRLDAELCRLARIKSQDMRSVRYFSHTSPTYGSPFDMMRSFGVRYSSAGENIAMGFFSPEAVVDAWMNSEGHRANILSARYSAIGVGYVPDGGYWTQWFIG